MIRVPIDDLPKRGAGRGEGFVVAIREKYPAVDGVHIVPLAEWYALARAHRAAQSPGLGDLVAAVATPIARALRLPCIDPATKQLRPDSACAQRKAALNRLG